MKRLAFILALIFSQVALAQQIVKPFAGGTGISQANTKTLTLSGPNSFTGATVASGQTLTLTGATVAGTPTWSSSQAITLSTAAQPNVTSLGTLTSLTSSGAISGTNVTGSTSLRAVKNGNDISGLGPYIILANAAQTSYVFTQLNASNGIDWWNDASTKIMTLGNAGGLAVSGTLSASTGGSTNHAVCWKAAGVLGYCSVVVDSSGVCGTCN